MCLWNPESWALESGIQLQESGIWLSNLEKYNNPESKYLESGIHRVKSGIHLVECRIPTILYYLTWG